MAKTKTATKKPATARKPNQYVLYMKHALPKFKAENPGVNHKAAYKQVSKNWHTAPENPKNQENST